MALFLETTHSSSSRYTGNLTDVAFDGIVLMQEEMNLMEAIYQADFIMHEQNKNLSESTRILKEGNFVMNVFAKIVEWAKQIWNWLKSFFIKVKDKIVEVFNRIKDHLTGNTATLSKVYVTKMEIAIDFMNEGKSWTKAIGKAKDLESVKSYGEKFKTMEKNLEKKLKEADKLKGTTTISMTYFDKISGAVKEIAKEIEDEISEIVSELESEASDLEESRSKVKEGAGEEAAAIATKHANEVIALKRGIIATIRLLGVKVGSIGSLVVQAASHAANLSKASPKESYAPDQ